jgi:hypothetical protein
MDDREDEVIEETISAALAGKEKESQPYYTGLKGRDYIQELLNCGNQKALFSGVTYVAIYFSGSSTLVRHKYRA